MSKRTGIYQLQIIRKYAKLVVNILWGNRYHFLKKNTTKTTSIATKKKRASLDDEILSALINQGLKCASHRNMGMLVKSNVDAIYFLLAFE
ncbi:MAG: hypothetical protein KAH18_08675 [Psychromonas sp.]|nr:hypothetical protein [Psychromonas sp.]